VRTRSIAVILSRESECHATDKDGISGPDRRKHQRVLNALQRRLLWQDLLSDSAVSGVANAVAAYREEIEPGALLSIDEGGTRVRMLLPLKDSRGPS
jgi:hypothetical protein